MKVVTENGTGIFMMKKNNWCELYRENKIAEFYETMNKMFRNLPI